MKKNVAKFLGILVCSVSVFGSGLVYGGKPWAINDDLILLNGISQMGGHWLIISKKGFNGVRTPSECKERYDTYLASGISKVWDKKEIHVLHRKVLAAGRCWKDLEQYFNLPAAIIINKYYQTLEEYKVFMKTMDEGCTWLPRELWVNDVDISD